MSSATTRAPTWRQAMAAERGTRARARRGAGGLWRRQTTDGWPKPAERPLEVDVLAEGPRHRCPPFVPESHQRPALIVGLAPGG